MGAGASKKGTGLDAATLAAVQALPAPYERGEEKCFYVYTALDEELARVGACGLGLYVALLDCWLVHGKVCQGA